MVTQGKIAYVPQQAWILNATIKENITLGDNIDKDVYEKAIDACALNQDLKRFNDGDLTEIGEKVRIYVEVFLVTPVTIVFKRQ